MFAEKNLERRPDTPNAAIQEILARASGYRHAADALDGELKLKDQLGIDSLKFITVMLDIEEALGRRIFTIENIPGIITVRDLLSVSAIPLER